MIAQLRKRHRIMIPALALITFPLFILALVNRPVIGKTRLDEQLIQQPKTDIFSREDRIVIFQGLENQVSARLRSTTNEKRRAVYIQVSRPVKSPSPLLYWQPADDFQQSVLIGAFPTTGEALLELAPMGEKISGRLIVYSLGHQEEIARANLEEQP